jgi:putative ABC transport system substrate-binding protein
MIRRREFIALVGGATAWPVAARAQQPAVPVIGFLSSAIPNLQAPRVRLVRQGLSEAGYLEGQNLAIVYRWAEDHNDRLPELAADLVRRQVRVIVTLGLPAALAAKGATTTVPIVASISEDPVETGLVAGLNRPGGNVTGVTNLDVELGPKRLELLHELAPGARTIALLLNPTNSSSAVQSRDLEAAARSLGLELHVLQASAERDFETVSAKLTELRVNGLVIGADAFLNGRLEQLASLALRQAVPAISHLRLFSAAGGLLSYGPRTDDEYRLAGAYAGRILKGEKPADLPVQQATKVELVINLKTAKALGLTVPITLLTRADELIE